MSGNDQIKQQRMHSKLLRQFRQFVEQEMLPIKTDPEPNWAMDWDRLSEEGKRRLEQWEVCCFYSEHLFPIRTKWYNDTTLEFAGPSELGRQIFVDQSFDPNEFWFLGQILEKGQTFVDVGANVGVYSLFAARQVGASGQVIAFEPSRRESRSLLRNMDINRISNVALHAFAIGEKSGTETLYIADAEYNGHNSLKGLSLSTTLPTVRFTTDRVHLFWSGVADGVTEIPIGKANCIEVLIYSDQYFSYELGSVQIDPADGMLGPWFVDGIDEEGQVETSHKLRERFPGFDIRSVYSPKVEVGNSIVISGSDGAGIVMRAELDGKKEYVLKIKGSSVDDRQIEQYPVEMISLDEFFADFQRESIDVIKIDIEGAEFDALRGAEKTISRYQPLLMVELINSSLEADVLEQFHVWFAERQYVLMDMLEGKPRLIDVRGEHASNVIACPQRLIAKVMALGGLDEKALFTHRGTMACVDGTNEDADESGVSCDMDDDIRAKDSGSGDAVLPIDQEQNEIEAGTRKNRKRQQAS